MKRTDRVANKLALLATVATAALSVGGRALAQDSAASQTRAQAGQGSPAAAAETPGAVGEVIVTAQRRAQNIQDVPESVAAVGSAALEQNNVHDLSRLDVLVPGFKFGTSGNDARPAIRGTRTQNIGTNNDPIVAFYNDGVYRSRPSQALGTFFDEDRVEVLRGPQGTLFGRNSFGGAVNVISRAPKLSGFDYGGSVDYGNYNSIRVEGFVNAPIGDKAALRLSVYDVSRDGWVKNSAGEDIHDDKNEAVRLQLYVKPTDDITNITRFEYWHGGGIAGADYGYFVPGIPIDPRTGATNGVNGVIDPRIAPNGNPNAGGYPGLLAGTRGDTDYKSIARNFKQKRQVDQFTLSDEFTANLGFADLKGIFSYTHYYELRQADADYTPQPINWENSATFVDTATEEIQLASKPNKRYSWVTGLYLLQDRPTGGFNFGTDFSNTALGTTQSFLYSRDPNGYFSGPDGFPTDSYAVYADGTYNVTDWLRLLGGVRYTEDQKSAYVNTNAGLGLPPNEGATASKDFDRLTYRAGVQADVTRHSMIYFTRSTGFLSGGFNDSNPVTNFGQTFASAYELGSKNVFLDGKLRANIAVYQNLYRAFLTQVLNFLPNGAVITNFANAGKIKSYGAEGEFDYNPVRGAYLGLRIAYTHARFGDFISPNSFVEGGNIPGVNAFQLRGLQVPLNPTLTATLIGSYDVETAAGVFTPSVTIFHSDSYRTSDQPYFFANQPAYETYDLHLRWRRSQESRLSVEAYGTNLSDERILLRTTPNGGSVIFQDFANPRFFGVRVAYNY